ncbi:MAG: winged helix DNA-binding protein [Clostridiales bacterium]|nr:winged helix DNA-binding protein [Clostridiales bacterium]
MRNYYIEINQYLERLIKNILAYDRDGIPIEGNTLSLMEILIIRFLGREGKKKIYEVIEELNIHRNSLVTITNRLQHMKYVKKAPSLEDGRVQTLKLTKEGMDIYNKIIQEEKEILFALLNGFTINEEKAILKFLVKLDMLKKEDTIEFLKQQSKTNKNI